MREPHCPGAIHESFVLPLPPLPAHAANSAYGRGPLRVGLRHPNDVERRPKCICLA